MSLVLMASRSREAYGFVLMASVKARLIAVCKSLQVSVLPESRLKFTLADHTDFRHTLSEKMQSHVGMSGHGPSAFPVSFVGGRYSQPCAQQLSKSLAKVNRCCSHLESTFYSSL